jgi:hypothetical protein
MRQAILVVDHVGRITDVRSRQAARLFGKDKQERNIAELLCEAWGWERCVPNWRASTTGSI